MRWPTEGKEIRKVWWGFQLIPEATVTLKPRAGSGYEELSPYSFWNGSWHVINTQYRWLLLLVEMGGAQRPSNLTSSLKGGWIWDSGRGSAWNRARKRVSGGALAATEPSSRFSVLYPHHRAASAGDPAISISTPGHHRAWRCHLSPINTGAKFKGHKHSWVYKPLMGKPSETSLLW